MDNWFSIKEEIDKDLEELKKIGLTDDEVIGYIEMFWENYYPPITEEKIVWN